MYTACNFIPKTAQVLGCTVLALLLLSAGRGAARAAARQWRIAPWWHPWCAWGQLTGEEISATRQGGGDRAALELHAVQAIVVEAEPLEVTAQLLKVASR